MELGAELGPEKGGLADTCGGSESIQTTPDGQSEARRLTLGGGVRDDGEAGGQASRWRHWMEAEEWCWCWKEERVVVVLEDAERRRVVGLVVAAAATMPQGAAVCRMDGRAVGRTG